MFQFNVNSYVHFRLSERGKQVLRDDEKFIIWSSRTGKDYYMQLHQFMSIVGPHMKFGVDSVIKHQLIYIEEKDLEKRDIGQNLE